jgi:D-glycero-D-manno-heptose 1,7-bisphosphate phosphatase
MFRAVFLDRDGVLIENRAEYVRAWSDVEIFPEAIEALSRLRGYKVVVVTNQSAVGRGLMTIETARTINEQLVEELEARGAQIDGVYMCPHAPGQNCECRKPHPGLILQAARELSLDVKRSWMIGDAWSDLLAGAAAGVRGVALLKTGRGNDQLLSPPPESLGEYFIFNDLAGALRSIQERDASAER